MTAHLRDDVLWAVGLAERLRMLQASFADDDAASRLDYLSEEIERALRDVPPGRRKAYLDALAERFPAWDGGAGRAPQAEPKFTAEAPEAPEALVERLAAMAHQLPNETRVALAARLQQAGFALATPPSAPPPQAAGDWGDVPPELQKKLSLDPSVPLDRVRAMKLAAVLIDLVVTMDQLAWNLWKNLAPNSIVRRDPGPAGDLRRVAGPYVQGDSEVSTVQVTQVLDKTRQLIAGLLAAIGSTGEAFARQYLSRFSPQSVKEIADAEPGFFIGPEQKCWRKYVQLFNEVSGVAIENEIANVIVKYTEDLILGAGRPASPPPDATV